jgi:hypothetical protein
MDVFNNPNDLALWSALVGLGLPWLVALIQQQSWPSWANALSFAAACFLAAAITEWIRNGDDWNATGYFHTFLVIVTAAIASYKLYWKPSGQIDQARSKYGLTSGKASPPQK